MTRSEFIGELFIQLAAKNTQLDRADVEVSVRHILDAMSSALEQHGRVEIRGFGSFDIRHRLPRKSHHPQTGEIFRVPAKSVPRFKAGKHLRECVNKKSPSSHGQTETVGIPQKNVEHPVRARTLKQQLME